MDENAERHSAYENTSPLAKEVRSPLSVRNDGQSLLPAPRNDTYRPADIRPSLLASALRYAECGMYVHPLRVGQKTPRWENWETRATRDPEQIRRLWTRSPFNIGVACGPSRLLVLDLDLPHEDENPPPSPTVTDGTSMLALLATRNKAQVPATLTVRTPSRGRHLVFRAPEGVNLRNTARTIGWCIDTRAAGGYVVGIGSVVNGHRYVLENGLTEPAELPDWLLRLVTAPPKPPKGGAPGSGAVLAARLAEVSGASRQERWAAGVLASECRDLAATVAGGRNDRLNLAAYRSGQLVGAGLLDQEQAEAALTAAAEAAGLGGDYALEVAKTLASGLRAGIARPRRMGDRAVRRAGSGAP